MGGRIASQSPRKTAKTSPASSSLAIRCIRRDAEKAALGTSAKIKAPCCLCRLTRRVRKKEEIAALVKN